MKKKNIVIIIIIMAIGILLSFTGLFSPTGFFVKGVHMEPTLKDGDKFFIKKEIIYSRGDIVIIKDPRDLKKYLVHRIIAVPTETIEIKDGNVYINNTLLKESHTQGETFPTRNILLKDNEYYVMGDNRMFSADSRLFGPISIDLILGKIKN